MQKKLFRPRDLLLAGGPLLIAAALFFASANAQKPAAAVLEQDGRFVCSFRLDDPSLPRLVEVPGEYPLEVWIEKDGARIQTADCPDQTCVRTGKLTRAGQTAICLPARFVLRLEGKEPGPDAVTG